MAVCLLLTALIADGLGPTVVPVAAGLLGGPEGGLNIGFAAAAFAGPIGCAIAFLARPGLVRLSGGAPAAAPAPAE